MLILYKADHHVIAMLLTHDIAEKMLIWH